MFTGAGRSARRVWLGRRLQLPARTDPIRIPKRGVQSPPTTLAWPGSLCPGRGGTPRRTSRERGISGVARPLQPSAAEGSCRERRVGPSPTARTLAAILLSPPFRHGHTAPAYACVDPTTPRPSTRLAPLTSSLRSPHRPDLTRSRCHKSAGERGPCRLGGSKKAQRR